MRHALGYGLVGLAQIVIDWAVFVALTAFALPVAAANLAGRVGGACFGYWANGRWTFRAIDGSHRLSGRSLRRFLVLWCATAAASTLLVTEVDALFGLRWAWVGKPVIDIGLAGVAFFVSKFWVYR